MLRLRLLLILCALLAPLVAARAQDDSAVPLPPFIVEEATKGPPWRYAELPGFEILSRCSDRTTRDLAAAHYRLHHLLNELVPERLQVTFTLPRVIIFYDEALQSAASQEVIADMLSKSAKESADLTPVVPMQIGSRGLTVNVPSARRVNFLPNLRLWDADSMVVFAIVREGSYDSDRLVLTPDYLKYLLLNRTPSLPAWFAAGVLALYDRTDYETNALGLRPLRWISDAQTSVVKDDPKKATAPLPLAQFFLGGVPARSEADGDARREWWVAQAALIVRWALDGKTPAQRAAFFDFVAQAAEEPVNERTFRDFFGVDFATADAQLAAYLPTAVRKSLTLKPERALKVPAMGLRNATDTEISRLKGDWERLEVGFVKKRSAELAAKYLEQARRTLGRAYEHGAREPQLLANLGLCECEAGDDVRARDYLEAAAQRGPIRPRANYELARLRLAAAEAAPADADGKLTAAQLTQVFTPLFAARAQQPPIPEVYELIARGWSRSAVPPSRGHLAVLDEGVRLFPRRLELIYRTAALLTERNFSADAAAMSEFGLHMAKDDADRARFVELQGKLAPGARPTSP
jgi:hypothetical protein